MHLLAVGVITCIRVCHDKYNISLLVVVYDNSSKPACMYIVVCYNQEGSFVLPFKCHAFATFIS